MGLVPLDESLPRMFQLHLLAEGGEEGRVGVRSYSECVLLDTYVGHTPL